MVPFDGEKEVVQHEPLLDGLLNSVTGSVAVDVTLLFPAGVTDHSLWENPSDSTSTTQLCSVHPPQSRISTKLGTSTAAVPERWEQLCPGLERTRGQYVYHTKSTVDGTCIINRSRGQGRPSLGWRVPCSHESRWAW